MTAMSQGATTVLLSYNDAIFTVTAEFVPQSKFPEPIRYPGLNVTIEASGAYSGILTQASFNLKPFVGVDDFSYIEGPGYDSPFRSVDGPEYIVDFYDQFKIESKTFTAGDEYSMFFLDRSEDDFDASSVEFQVVDTEGLTIRNYREVFRTGHPSVMILGDAPIETQPITFTSQIPEPSTLAMAFIALLALGRRNR